MGHVVLNRIQLFLLDGLTCLTRWNEADLPPTWPFPAHPAAFARPNEKLNVTTHDSRHLFF